MTVIGHLFTIIIFVSFVGSIFTILSLLAKKVLHIALPLWFSVCNIIFYLEPIILPTLWLVTPEETSWVHGYQVACTVWGGGAVVFSLYYAVRNICVYCAIKKYHVCDDKRINRVYGDCIAACV